MQFEAATYDLIQKELKGCFYESVQVGGLPVHCKVMYSLDKAGELFKKPALLNLMDHFFAVNFDKVAPSNLINIANIFAKNRHVQLYNADGSDSYLQLIELKFSNRNRIVEAT